MKILNVSLAAALVTGGLSFMAPANAQSSSCTCTAVTGSNAIVSNVAGDVSYSSASGYVQLVDGTTVPVGSQILFGDGSSATISVGSSCNLNVGGNSELNLFTAGADVCVQVSSLNGATLSDAYTPDGLTVAQTTNTPPVVDPTVLLGIAAVAGGAVLVFDDDDNPPPASP